MAGPTSHDLILDRVSKRYQAVTVVDRVDLRIPGGTFFSLLGPSGSGKTTLLMIIAGFAMPDEGTVRLGARDITDVPPEKRQFGMVFQGYALFPNMTVGENVAFALRVRGLARAERDRRVRAALDMVHLSGYEARLPKQLSGGQQQRVALARALVFEPEVLLLDEPLSALDKKLREGLQVELCDLQKRVGKTFICVTHDQDEALSMSDRIAIVRNGGIVQEGAPGDLFERPSSHFVADFLGESNFLSGEVLGPSRDGMVSFAIAGTTLTQATDIVPDALMLVALRPSKIEIDQAQPAEATNCVPGRVSSWSYRGTEVRCQVETPLGRLAVVTPTWRARFVPERGQPVWLSWSPDAAVVVTDDRASDVVGGVVRKAHAPNGRDER